MVVDMAAVATADPVAAVVTRTGTIMERVDTALKTTTPEGKPKGLGDLRPPNCPSSLSQHANLSVAIAS